MNQLQYYRALLILNGIVPLMVLVWDAYQGQLGANSVNYALHVTGILSLVFLFLSLTAAPLRWLTGWGGWIALRRALGLYGFFYAVVHVAIYVGLDRELNLASTAKEIWLRRFLQVGTVAVLLMVPLAVTSTNAMIRRLGPKRWKQLHKLAYVATALGVAHYFLLVKSDVRQPLAFAAVLTGLLGTRLGRRYFDARLTRRANEGRQLTQKATGQSSSGSRGRPWKGELQVESITQVTHDVKTFRLRKPITAAVNAAVNEPLPFSYLPGQFVNLQMTVDGNRVHRCYSLASSPMLARACELTIKRDPQGLASRYLHDQLAVGDLLRIVAPGGRFFFTGDDADEVLLIAGGVGITPVMSIARYLTDRSWKGQIYFVVVARTEQDIIFYDELRRLQEHHNNFKLCIALTQADPVSAWPGHCGFLTEALLQEFVGLHSQMPVFLCGPKGMMQATRELLLKAGASEALIHTEEFVSPRSSVFAEEPVDDPVTNARITFSRSNVDTECESNMSVLEAAEEAAVDMSYECRSGICGQCKTRLLSGLVRMDSEDALTGAEKADGWILACQAHPQSDLVIDA